jgi:hypothetical protein
MALRMLRQIIGFKESALAEVNHPLIYLIILEIIQAYTPSCKDREMILVLIIEKNLS